jgi:hypothetical protein
MVYGNLCHLSMRIVQGLVPGLVQGLTYALSKDERNLLHAKHLMMTFCCSFRNKEILRFLERGEEPGAMRGHVFSSASL